MEDLVAEDLDALVGHTIGTFTLEARLGTGAMAAVYRAYDQALERPVAVKLLPAHLTQDPGYVERFRREARLVAGLSHSHVVPIYHFGEEHRRLFLVMPVLQGSLRDRLEREGMLPPAEAIRLVVQVADGLAAAHAVGLVHRDVKPENILLDAEGNALLADFGLARDLVTLQQGDTVPTIGDTGLPVGTPQYMAPEQLQGFPLDQRTDLYALGVVLYELLTGAAPHVGPTPYAVAALALTAPIPRPSARNGAIWPALDHAVLRALARSPQQRWATAADFARALQDARSQEHTPAVWYRTWGSALRAVFLRVRGGPGPTDATAATDAAARIQATVAGNVGHWEVGSPPTRHTPPPPDPARNGEDEAAPYAAESSLAPSSSVVSGLPPSAPLDGSASAGQAAMQPTGARQPVRLRSWPAVLALYLLAPLFGEVLSWSTPPLRFLLDPTKWIFEPALYGSSAILIRELARRRGLGWGNIFLLGMAYGVFEEGLLIQTWFNPAGLHPLGVYGRAWGINWVWATGLTLYHAAFSITIPILLVEALFPHIAARPWLSPRGTQRFLQWLGAVSVISFIGYGFLLSRRQGYTHPPLLPYLLAVAVTLSLLWLGLYLRMPSPLVRLARQAPPLWTVRIAAWAVTLAFFCTFYGLPALMHSALVVLAVLVALAALSAVQVRRWALRTGWGVQHRLALASGATAFWIAASLISGVIGLPLVAVLLLVLLIWLAQREHGDQGKQREQGQRTPLWQPPAAPGT